MRVRPRPSPLAPLSRPSRLSRLLRAGFIVLLLSASFGGRSISGQAGSPDGLWQPVGVPESAAADVQRARPAQRAFRMDAGRLTEQLTAARRTLDDNAPRITLPLPDGRYVQFRVYETDVMEPELAASLGGFRTFRGVATDDATIVARLEHGPEGLRAVITSREGRFFVEPTQNSPAQPYVAFRAERRPRPRTERSGPPQGAAAPPPPRCLVTSDRARTDRARDVASRRERARSSELPGQNLRVYRLAMSATGEYTQTKGGTVASASRAIASTVNRVNEVFEADLGVSFRLVARNSELVHTDAATDPFTNDDAEQLLPQNQAQLDARLGSAAYDIGHVLSTGAGGLARLDATCGAGIKAQGATGKADPTGDPFDIDYVAHELGHQMGGNHTFNGTTGSCGGRNRNAGTAFEPGSGSTVMAYAGICGDDNLQQNSHAYFHAGSLDEMWTFLTIGGGSTCGTRTATGNTPPAVSVAQASIVVPKATPFRLKGSATDSSPGLMFVWEEMDLGPEGPPDHDQDGRLRPLFRSRMPEREPVRQFPFADVLLSGTVVAGERLPAVARALRFRLTARDYAAPAGGHGHAESTVTVANSGPLRVTKPDANSSWRAGSSQTVKWTVNNTNRAPVNCQTVQLLLSTDGGRTYPTVLNASTPNDGSELVNLPTSPVAPGQTRIMVECTTSPFFNVSAAFTVTEPLVTRAR